MASDGESPDWQRKWRPAARTEKAVEAPRLPLSQRWLTDLGQTHKPAGAAQRLHTYEQGDTKTRLNFALVNEAFRAAVGDFEVIQRNLSPNTKWLKITLTQDTYEQKVWMMRQPTTLNAEDQQLELTFRRKWKQVNHEYEQGSFVQSMQIHSDSSEAEIHAAQGQNSEIHLGHRQLHNWANKIAGFRDEWKKEERAKDVRAITLASTLYCAWSSTRYREAMTWAKKHGSTKLCTEESQVPECRMPSGRSC